LVEPTRYSGGQLASASARRASKCGSGRRSASATVATRILGSERLNVRRAKHSGTWKRHKPSRQVDDSGLRTTHARLCLGRSSVQWARALGHQSKLLVTLALSLTRSNTCARLPRAHSASVEELGERRRRHAHVESHSQQLVCAVASSSLSFC
jgi:hypothetical protein